MSRFLIDVTITLQMVGTYDVPYGAFGTPAAAYFGQYGAAAASATAAAAAAAAARLVTATVHVIMKLGLH